MRGGYYAVTVSVIPGSETPVPEFQTARERAAAASEFPEVLFNAFNGDEEKIREFVGKVKALPAKRIDPHEAECGRARFLAEILRVSGDSDFFMGADPRDVQEYILESLGI